MSQFHETSHENKSVNVSLDNCISEETTPKTSENTVENIRQRLQNVIDHMGPDTPHLHMTTTSCAKCVDCDNEQSREESYYKSTSIVTHRSSYVKQVQIETTCDTSSEISAIPSDSLKIECCDAEVQCSPTTVPAPLNPCYICCHIPCYCSNVNHQTVMNPFCHLCQEPVHVHHETETRPKPTKLSPNQGRRYRLNAIKKNKWLSKCINNNDSEFKNDTVDLYVPNSREHHPPERLVFDLVTGVLQPETTNICTNTGTNMISTAVNTCSKQIKISEMNTETVAKGKEVKTCRSRLSEICEKKKSPKIVTSPLCGDSIFRPSTACNKSKINSCNEKKETKVEVYYFDHGNNAFYCTTDNPPVITTDLIGEKSEYYATKFWAESFGAAYIGFAFVTAFVLQLFKFVLYGIIRPIVVGLLQLFCDYLLKPLLALIFNGVIQPILIFFYNVATSLRDICDPIAEGCGYFFQEFAHLCRSIRLCDYNKTIKSNNCKDEKIKCRTPCSSSVKRDIKCEDLC